MNNFSYHAIDMMLSELPEPINVYFELDHLEYGKRYGEWVYRIQVTSDNGLIVHGATGYNKERAYEDALRHALGVGSLEDQEIL